MVGFVVVIIIVTCLVAIIIVIVVIVIIVIIIIRITMIMLIISIALPIIISALLGCFSDLRLCVIIPSSEAVGEISALQAEMQATKHCCTVADDLKTTKDELQKIHSGVNKLIMDGGANVEKFQELMRNGSDLLLKCSKDIKTAKAILAIHSPKAKAKPKPKPKPKPAPQA